MKHLALALAIVSVFLVSCRPGYVRKGLRDIRSERLKLTEAEANFLVLDTAQVRGITKSYFAQIDSINKYFKDQYSDGAWKLMTEFGLIKKPLKVYLEDYASIKNSYTYSISQLADLEADLRDKRISREQYDIYMKSEKDANDQLMMRSNLVSENAVRRVNHYNQISPRIDSLIIVFKAGTK